ncbi:MAG: DnaJ domain-containing protein [Gemmatimonadota bacterium]|nr:DnaJ domain-containing protein [Gemmatimonadota bacterium]
MANSDDLYEVLQVQDSADPEVIDAAYRSLARKYHPDVNNSSDAKERMQRINYAYNVLRDPWKRSIYDQKRHTDGRTERQRQKETEGRQRSSNAQESSRIPARLAIILGILSTLALVLILSEEKRSNGTANTSTPRSALSNQSQKPKQPVPPRTLPDRRQPEPLYPVRTVQKREQPADNWSVLLQFLFRLERSLKYSPV